MKQGRIFAVVGPSGAGKDTLIALALAARPGLHLVRRVITRPEAAGGEPYEGATPETFAARLEAGEFALHWQAHGLRYGIPKAQLLPLARGQDVVFNGSRAALPLAAALFPDLTVVLITAPPEVLAARLTARGREDAQDVAARVKRGGMDLPPQLDMGLRTVTVMNDTTPEEGAARLLAALQPVSA